MRNSDGGHENLVYRAMKGMNNLEASENTFVVRAFADRLCRMSSDGVRRDGFGTEDWNSVDIEGRLFESAVQPHACSYDLRR